MIVKPDVPYIDLALLAPQTHILVETTESIWSITTLPNGLLALTGTDPRFKSPAPVVGKLIESVAPGESRKIAPETIAKGWRFLVEFANVILVSEPVVSALIERDCWHYEAIED